MRPGSSHEDEVQQGGQQNRYSRHSNRSSQPLTDQEVEEGFQQLERQKGGVGGEGRGGEGRGGEGRGGEGRGGEGRGGEGRGGEGEGEGEGCDGLYQAKYAPI